MVWGCLGAAPSLLAELPSGAVLVYRVETQRSTKPFVVRIGRFRPDIVLEWESESHQGTVHFHSVAVSSADKLLTTGIFEPGVDQEFGDAMGRWLSSQMYRKLTQSGRVKVRLNNFSSQLVLRGRGSVEVSWNGTPQELPVVLVEDGRGGRWSFLDSAENPLLVTYENPYYAEILERVAIENASKLRWLKRMPPIK
ncbi:MAG TPA: hypothetical protein PLM33_04195 [Acidobacteriota bacterium]|nr:hypothetical protein [Acidobacteriota bacterium]HRV08713.1 hypothetical protein [Acidobacteriota bacterium]